MNNVRMNFLKLQRHFHPEMSVHVRISDIATVFGCTSRNVRNILKGLQKSGLIEWYPEAGRNKKSRLVFTLSASEMKNDSVQEFVEKGKIADALKLIGDDASKIGIQLFNHLGAFLQGDNRIVRVPWYRSIDVLEPWKPHRRTERHLLKQCYAGLTRYEKDLDRSVPDLAHHWMSSIDSIHWDFYLRPGLRFSDGSECTAKEVERCLLSAFHSPAFSNLYRSIKTIHVIDELHIKFTLNESNVNLPSVLSHPSALVYSSSDGKIKYTGPWQIIEHTDYSLILKVNPWYYGIRPVLDEVNILRVDPEKLDMGNIQVYYQGMNDTGYSDKETKLERGSCYLIVDALGAYADQEDRIFLNHVLQPVDILRNSFQDRKVTLNLSAAQGLLPGWYHRLIDVVPPIRKKMYKELHLATFYQPELIKHAEGISVILDRFGIKCKITKMTYQEFMMYPPQGVDLWLTNVMLDDMSVFSLYSWFVVDPILEKCDGELRKEKNKIQRMFEINVNECEENIEKIIKKMTFARWFIPLVYHWIDSDVSNSPSQTNINELGWVDFSQAWFDFD